MFVHPSIYLEIARQRQHDLLASAERRRIAQAALAGRQEDEGRSLSTRPALHEPSPPTTAPRPQQAKA
jgi:hypothetical protein